MDRLNMYLYPLPARFICHQNLCMKNEAGKLINYEDFLFELVNKSEFFLELSNGEQFNQPVHESNGECDCISRTYSLDFKIFASNSFMEAHGLSSFVTVDSGDGSQTDYYRTNLSKECQFTTLNTLLKRCSLQDLFTVDKGKTLKNRLDYRDVKSMIKLLKAKKNLLLFFPFNVNTEQFLGSGDKTTIDDVQLESIIDRLSSDLNPAFEYRLRVCKDFDTYFCFIHCGYMIVTKLEDKSGKPHLMFLEKIELTSSDSFSKILCSIDSLSEDYPWRKFIDNL